MRTVQALVFLALPFALAACHHGEGSAALPTGQVIATVDGRDITTSELEAELTGQQFTSEAERKRAADAALNGLVARTILANIAREQKLDQDPNYVLQQHRANEILLAQNLQAGIADKVAAATEDEITRYITAHPELFARRTIYSLDQIKFRAPAEVAKLRAYSPLKTLRDIEQKLIEDRTAYDHTNTTLDVLAADPALPVAIAKLPADEVFLIPKNDIIYANRVTSASIQPFIGPRARAYAAIALRNTAIEKATLATIGDKVKVARARVKYQIGFAPAMPAAR